MKKITLDLVKNEAIDAAAASAGVVGASLLMGIVKGKVNPWLLPLIGFTGGFATRLFSDNSTVKDVGTGMMIAGVLDGVKKGLDKFKGKVDVLDQINASVPTLSGTVGNNAIWDARIIPNNLRGNYQPAEVVMDKPSALLR